MDKMPKIPTSLKTSVINEWLDVFPELSKYKPTKLYCRRGSVLIGLEFQWLMGNTRYRPYYEIVPLFDSSVNDLTIALIYPVYSIVGTLDLIIEPKSLDQFLNGNILAIREHVLNQCIVPFNKKMTTKELAQYILAECERTKSKIHGDRLFIYEMLIMFASLLREEDKGYSETLFKYAIDNIARMKDDYVCRISMEQEFKKTYDEIVKEFESKYYSIDYAKVIEESVQKFKLGKLKEM